MFELSRGTYVPSFKFRSAAVTPPAARSDQQLRRGIASQKWLLLPLAAVVLIAIGFLGPKVRLEWTSNPSTTSATPARGDLLTVEDLASGHSVNVFEIFWRDDLVAQNQFRQIWRVLRQSLHHGLAHVHDAKKEYALAAEHAAKGNELRKEVWARQGKTYAREDHSGFVSFLMKQFQPAFFGGQTSGASSSIKRPAPRMLYACSRASNPAMTNGRIDASD